MAVRSPINWQPEMEESLNADGEHFFRTSRWRGRNMLRVSIIEDGTGMTAIDKLGAKIERCWKALCT